MTPQQAAQQALDSGQITPQEYMLQMQEIEDAAKSGQTSPAATASPLASTPGPNMSSGAPSGIDPAQWAQLSPGAQQVVQARMATQGHPFSPAAPLAGGQSPGDYQQQSAEIWNNPQLSYQQKLAAQKQLGPAPAAPAQPAAPLTPAEQLEADRKAGTISYQQYREALKDPEHYANPNKPKEAVTSEPTKPAHLTGAPTSTGASGVASQQGSTGDPTAFLLRPGAGVAAHAHGFSPADKNMLGSLNDQAHAAQGDTAELTQRIGDIATGFADQSKALAAQSQQGLLDYQQQQRDLAERRKQLDDDARAERDRIAAKMADLEATGVDPNAYFHNQSTGMNILGALAVGLGAFGSHALGPNGHDSTNTALEIMNGAIARDIDAQKANLQHSVSLLGKQIDLSGQGFDQQKAMLEAERESVQSAYMVAQNEVAKRAAALKDNADVQTNATKLIGGLKAAADERVGALNEKIYAIQKGAEKVVGGAASGDIAKRIVARSEKIRDDAAAHGKDITSEEAHRQAVLDELGVDVAPGTERASYAAPPKAGAGNLSPRLARRAAELDALDQNATELQRLLANGSSLSIPDRRRAAALAETLRNAGHKSVPENPLQLIDNTSGRAAGLDEVRKDIRREKTALMQYGGGGGGGADEADRDNPAGLEKEEE